MALELWMYYRRIVFSGIRRRFGRFRSNIQIRTRRGFFSKRTGERFEKQENVLFEVRDDKHERVFLNRNRRRFEKQENLLVMMKYRIREIFLFFMKF